jgi:pimeloyl-ACP methyl ester carboxylesterase
MTKYSTLIGGPGRLGLLSLARRPSHLWLAIGLGLFGLSPGLGASVSPKITLQPSDAALASGQTVTFSVAAAGTSPLSFQWRQDGVDLPGATRATLTLHSIQLTNAGAYSVLVTNVAGAATSGFAQLSVADGSSFTNAQGTKHPYRLFMPPKYDPGTKYPLVLYWHGADGIGTDNRAQLSDWGQFSFLTASNVASFPCFFLAPQIPGVPPSAAYANAFLDWATNLLDYLQAQYSIDPDRLYVTGVSMGGRVTWAMLARCPGLLAAALPMSGDWNNSGDFARSTQVPVWNFHAADDPEVPVSGSDSAVLSLRSTGARIVYTRYRIGGHGIWSEGYSTAPLIDWVMSQKRGVASQAEPLLSITTPAKALVYSTGATNLNLAGTAGAQGQVITNVTWTNASSSSFGSASGTNTWSVTGIPLVPAATNSIIVTATTTSWATAIGGNTTFNDTLMVIQSPILATLSLRGTNALLTWTGGAGPYHVQRATDLVAGDWTELSSNATPPLILPVPPGSQAAFYRIGGQ